MEVGVVGVKEFGERMVSGGKWELSCGESHLLLEIQNGTVTNAIWKCEILSNRFCTGPVWREEWEERK